MKKLIFTTLLLFLTAGTTFAQSTTPFIFTDDIIVQWEATSASGWADIQGRRNLTANTGSIITTPSPATNMNIAATYYNTRSDNNWATTDTFGNMAVTGSGTSNIVMELFFRPTDLVGNESLWETGGNGDGTAIYLNGANVVHTALNGGNMSSIKYALTAADISDFTQFVGITDMTPARYTMVFVNGKCVGQRAFSGTDWCGTDGSGFGRVNGTSAADDEGVATGRFNGEIASGRHYVPTDWALTSATLLQNYVSTAGTDYDYGALIYQPGLHFDTDANLLPADGQDHLMFGAGTYNTFTSTQTYRTTLVRDTDATATAANFTNGAVLVCGYGVAPATQGVLTLSGTRADGYLLMGDGGTLSVSGSDAEWNAAGGGVLVVSQGQTNFEFADGVNLVRSNIAVANGIYAQAAIYVKDEASGILRINSLGATGGIVAGQAAGESAFGIRFEGDNTYPAFQINPVGATNKLVINAGTVGVDGRGLGIYTLRDLQIGTSASPTSGSITANAQNTANIAYGIRSNDVNATLDVHFDTMVFGTTLVGATGAAISATGQLTGSFRNTTFPANFTNAIEGGATASDLVFLGGNDVQSDILLSTPNDLMTLMADGLSTSTLTNIDFGAGNDTLSLAGGAVDSTDVTTFSTGVLTNLENLVFTTGAGDSVLDVQGVQMDAVIGQNYTFTTNALSVAGKTLTLIGPGAMGANDFSFDFSGCTEEAHFLLHESLAMPYITSTGDRTATFVGAAVTTSVGPFLLQDQGGGAGQQLTFAGGTSLTEISEIIFRESDTHTVDFRNGATEFGGTVKKMTVESTVNAITINAPSAGLDVTDGIDIVAANTNTTFNVTGALRSDLNYLVAGNHAPVLANGITGGINLSVGVSTLNLLNVGDAITNGVTVPGGANVTMTNTGTGILGGINVASGSTLNVIKTDTGGEYVATGDIIVDWESLNVDVSAMSQTLGQEFVVLESQAGLIYNTAMTAWNDTYAGNLDIPDFKPDYGLFFSCDGKILTGQFAKPLVPEKIAGVTNPEALEALLYGPDAEPGSASAKMQEELRKLRQSGSSYQELDKIVQQFTQSMAAANISLTHQINQTHLWQIGLKLNSPWETSWRSISRGNNTQRGQNAYYPSVIMSPSALSSKSIWVESFGYGGKQRMKDDFAPYDSNGWGLTLGFDQYTSSGRALFGVAYGMSNNTLNTKVWQTQLGETIAPNHVETETHTLIGYGLFHLGPKVYLSAKIGGTASIVKGTRRPTPTTDSTWKTDGATFLLQSTAGFKILETQRWRITPKIRLSYFNYGQSAYEELTSDGTNSVDAFQNGYCELDAMIDLAVWMTDRTMVYSRVGYRKLAGAKNVVLGMHNGGISYNVVGVGAPESVFLLDLGSDIQFTENLSLLSELNVRIGEGGSELWGGTGALAWRF